MKIGIIGTGRIAKRFVPECLAVTGMKITAVYNPHPGSAARFVAEVFVSNDTDDAAGKSRDSGNLPEATERADFFFGLVEAVYIASPHETHYGYIMEALRQGKHVLCEKPLVLKKNEAKEALAFAGEQNLVLMEGIKTAYAPGYQKFLKVAAGGVIGEIRYLDACFTKLEKPESREMTDEAYGGSFTELGSYVSLPVFDFFGASCDNISFDSIVADGNKKIDIFTRANFRYPGGMANVICGLGVKSEGRLLIGGTKGYIVVPAPWWKTSRFEAHFEDAQKVIAYEVPFEGEGLRYEIRTFLERTKSPELRTECSETQRMVWCAGVMETFRNFTESRNETVSQEPV